MSAEAAARALRVAELRRVCDPASLPFASTAEVDPLEGTAGQRRASDAIAFGLQIETAGYNLFATGPVGTGKRTSLESHLKEHAHGRPTPGDWVYLHNFVDSRRPIAVPLPSGRARELQSEMRTFLQDARRELAGALESETYAQRQHEVTEPLEHEQEAAFGELRERARAVGIAIEITPSGVITVPLRGTHPMTPAEFAELPEPVRARYQSSIEQLAPHMQAFITRMRSLQREGRNRVRALEREVALFAIGHLIEEIQERHRDSEKLRAWLAAVADDVTENLALFQQTAPSGPGAADTPEQLAAALGAAEQPLARYEVNVFVAHETADGAPVVLETNPTYPNLFGRIEHRGVLGGGFVTDHRMLRAGAVHRANGGYLMLPAAEVLSSRSCGRCSRTCCARRRSGWRTPASSSRCCRPRH